MHTRSLEFTLFAIACLLFSACVESKCLRDEDCGSGQVCITATGACINAECTDHDACGDGQICEDSFCVAGCLTTSDCDQGQSCYNNRCAEVQSECGCPTAYAFCGTDINPNSDTSGQEVCVPDSYDSGVALFYGSLKCGICRGIFFTLMDVKTLLEANGEDPQLIFVQSKYSTVDPSGVETYVGSADAAVIQSTYEADIWEAYNAAQYDLTMIDSNSCITEHYVHLTSADLEGELGTEIDEAWRAAMSGDCPE